MRWYWWEKSKIKSPEPSELQSFGWAKPLRPSITDRTASCPWTKRSSMPRLGQAWGFVLCVPWRPISRRDSEPALLLLSRSVFCHSQRSLVSSRSWTWPISLGSHLSVENNGSGDFSVVWRRYFMGSLLMSTCPEAGTKQSRVWGGWENGHITNNLSVSLTELNHHFLVIVLNHRFVSPFPTHFPNSCIKVLVPVWFLFGVGACSVVRWSEGGALLWRSVLRGR